MTTGVVALLFTDLVGSTELLGRLGEDAAEDLRRVHFGLLRAQLAAAGGREVKTLGDGLMAVFASPLEALGCAAAMQQAMAGHNEADPQRRLAIRIGIHAGEPVQDEGDFHGSAVVVARRLCDAADGGQILASELVSALVGSRGDAACSCWVSWASARPPHGRLDESFDYAGHSVHPHVFRSALAKRPEVTEYQVRQTPRGAHVAIRCEEPIDLRALETELAAGLTRLGVPLPEVAA